MSSNEKERNNHSRGHGPMRVSEKPKDFMGSIKKLMKSLSSFRVLIFIALVLAALSSILSLIAPNKLSDLTDEITKGITINTMNAFQHHTTTDQTIHASMTDSAISKFMGITYWLNIALKELLN